MLVTSLARSPSSRPRSRPTRCTARRNSSGSPAGPSRGHCARSSAFDEALDIQLRLAEQGPADGYVSEELAELLLATGDKVGAAEHAATANRLLGADSWFAEYESGRLDRLRQLAEGG